MFFLMIVISWYWVAFVTWTASRNWCTLFVDVALQLWSDALFGKNFRASRFRKFFNFRKLPLAVENHLFFYRIKKTWKLKKVRQLQSLDISTSATSHECSFNRESNGKCCFWFMFLLDFLLKLHSWLVTEVDMSKLRSCPTFFSFNIYFVGQK